MNTLDIVLLLLAIGLCSGAFALALALQRRHNRQQAELIQRFRDRGPVRLVGIPSPISRIPSDRQARQSLHTQSSSPAATHPPVGFALFDSSGPIAGSANDFAPQRGFDGGSSAGGGSSGSWDSSPHDAGSSSGSCGGGGGD